MTSHNTTERTHLAGTQGEAARGVWWSYHENFHLCTIFARVYHLAAVADLAMHAARPANAAYININGINTSKNSITAVALWGVGGSGIIGVFCVVQLRR
jgi:hypothetical protein